MKNRFLSKFIKNENNGCWEWNAGLFHSGYGKFWYIKSNVNAHRVSYLLFKGDIPDNLEVCHTCDNKKCVNPDHLWLGTHQENMNDMIKKGRNKCGYHGGHRKRNGKRNGKKNRKLSIDDIEHIRTVYKPRVFSQRKIAKLYSVDQKTICNIVRYKNSYSKDLVECQSS